MSWPSLFHASPSSTFTQARVSQPVTAACAAHLAQGLSGRIVLELPDGISGISIYPYTVVGGVNMARWDLGRPDGDFRSWHPGRRLRQRGV